VAFVAAQLGDTTRANAIAATLPARAAISRDEIAALVARARGDTATWIAKLQTAAKADEARGHLGPPSVFPPHELLGNALLEVGRAKEAIAAYRKELELMPNRSNALLGLVRAQRAAGDSAAAARTATRVKTNWQAADAGVTSRIASRE
jgi:hypothetical protein